MNRKLWRGVLCGLPLVAACAGSALFEPIGTNMANPLTLAVDSTAQRAYILNSNDKYLYTQGSLHVVDLSTITAPTRVNSTAFASYGGQLYLDAAAKQLYMPDRASDGETDITDQLLQFNVDEASASFLTATSAAANGDPYSALFDAANNRLLVTTQEETVDVFAVGGATPTRTAQVQFLDQSLSTGSTIRGTSLSDAVLINNGAQAVVTNLNGGVFVLNTSEIGVSGVQPIDYFIEDVILPRGLARLGDATSRVVGVVSKDVENDEIVYRVRVLNLATLDPSASNSIISVLDKDDNSLLSTSIAVGADAQQIVVSTLRNQAYVSNYDDDTISVIDLSNNTVTATITVGDEPYGLALYQQTAGADTHLLVTNHGGNTVSIIDLASNAIVGTYP